MIALEQEKKQFGAVATIKVIGIGGAGGNTVNSIIDAGVQGFECIVANTDSQALENSKASNKLQIGIKSTKGLGTGANPEVGQRAAEEDLDKVMDTIGDADIVVIAAGMGGGTGSGGAPVIARACREKGILSIAVVTLTTVAIVAALMHPADETEIEESTVSHAVFFESFDGSLHGSFLDLGEHFGIDEPARRHGPHPARVRPLIVVSDALVIPRRGQDLVSAIHHGAEYRNFRPLEVFLHEHSSFAEFVLFENHLQKVVGFTFVRADRHTFPRRQTIEL